MNIRDWTRVSRSRTGSPSFKWQAPGGIVMTMVTALGVSSAALAQSEGQAVNSSGLEEVLVTATRREESVRDVPISVAVFSDKQMDMQGMRSVDDLARFAPGVTFSRNTGLGNDL